MDTLFYTVWHNKYLRQHIYAQIRGLNAEKAAKYGNLEAFKYSVLENYTVFVINKAIHYDHLEVLKWLINNRKEECLKWSNICREFGCCAADKSHLIINAAIHGHFKMVKWLYKKYPNSCLKCALNYADGRGHIHIVKWLYKNSSEDVYIEGNLEFLYTNYNDSNQTNQDDFTYTGKSKKLK